jgi:SAM-dependent methyltransferase
VDYALRFLSSHGLFPEKNGSKVLEVGCGFGFNLMAAERLGWQGLMGIEIDPASHSRATESGLTVYLGDATQLLDGLEEKFDLVLLLDVLEHQPKSAQLDLLRKCSNRLSDRGVLVVSVPNAHAPLAPYFQNIDWTHYDSFTESSLDFLALNSDLAWTHFRPSHQESIILRWLKRRQARLLFWEFEIKDPILTPSIVMFASKSQDALDAVVQRCEVYKGYHSALRPLVLLRRAIGIMQRVKL